MPFVCKGLIYIDLYLWSTEQYRKGAMLNQFHQRVTFNSTNGYKEILNNHLLSNFWTLSAPKGQFLPQSGG